MPGAGPPEAAPERGGCRSRNAQGPVLLPPWSPGVTPGAGRPEPDAGRQPPGGAAARGALRPETEPSRPGLGVAPAIACGSDAERWAGLGGAAMRRRGTTRKTPRPGIRVGRRGSARAAEKPAAPGGRRRKGGRGERNVSREASAVRGGSQRPPAPAGRWLGARWPVKGARRAQPPPGGGVAHGGGAASAPPREHFGSRGGEAKGRRRHEASRRGMGEARASRAAALSQEAGAVVPSAAGFRRPRSPDCRTSGAPEVFPPPWSPPD